MLALISSLLGIFGPLFGFLVKLFIRKKDAQAKAMKNFYSLLARMDKKSDAKVKRHLDAEAALTKIQNQIREKTLIEPDRETDRKMRGYDVPEIIDVDVFVKTHGKYLTDSGQAKGLVVHSTAGRYENGRQDAINTLTSLAKRGLGCFVMDYNGQIYKAKNQSMNDIAYHAGKSGYLGFKGMSRYCYGMEICNAGKLDNKGNTWYGTTTPKLERRAIADQNQNQKWGTYHKFSAAQQESLVNFVLWQLDINPEFTLDLNIGHDECAPDRKTDPGGSLSMTMPAFRTMIRQQII
jgi:hypothetical protein